MIVSEIKEIKIILKIPLTTGGGIHSIFDKYVPITLQQNARSVYSYGSMAVMASRY